MISPRLSDSATSSASVDDFVTILCFDDFNTMAPFCYTLLCYTFVTLCYATLCYATLCYVTLMSDYETGVRLCVVVSTKRCVNVSIDNDVLVAVVADIRSILDAVLAPQCP
jgi:hypothetical protein